MRTIPLWLLAALGVLSTTALAADPSEWKCESCQFPDEGISGSVDAGIGAVSKDSATFGNFTGLDEKGAFAVAGGSVRYRGGNGVFGRADAQDLGLDVRELSSEVGREGIYTLRLGYAELPHLFTDSARTPFLGSGGATLTLPAGFPAATTGLMPLDSTLQPVDLGFKRKRLDVGATVLGSAGWSYALDVRHIVRDGTRRSAGSFFSNASQFAAPVDDVTDQIDASVSYASRRLQATLAYHGSFYRSGPEALTWQNPFTPIVAGADAGQLALAPDNEFHQLSASIGYDFTPAVRASGELAVGRMTQDAPFLAPTLNPNLVVVLPASSLHGKVNTWDATVRVTADLTPRLRVSAAAIHNERDNDTPIIEIPAVSTDMFLGATPVSNTPYSFKRDRVKVSGDLRGLGPIKLSAGAEYDVVDRARQETDETREATVWARAGAQVRENLSLTAKAAHAERDNSGYGVLASVQPPENPLLRKFNQADRRRDSGGVRADLGIGKSASVGVAIDAAADDYTDSPVGLIEARSAGVTVDGSVAVSDETRLHAFAQAERIRSDQAGSQQFGAADWRARTKDAIDVVGAGITHTALKGKLELGADLAFSRMRTDIRVDGSEFPTAKTSVDSLKLRATWQLKERLSLLASWWYERYDAKDWRLDGVLPATVPNLLALGEQPPTFHVNVLRLAVRYGF